MLAVPTLKTCTFSGHTGPILAVRYNPDGNYCITCGQDRLMRLCNPVKGVTIKTYIGHGHEVLDVAIAEDNSRLASCGGDKLVFYWDVATGNIIRKFRGHELRVNSVKFAGEGCSVIVSGSYDKTVRFFDCRSRSLDPIQTIDCCRDSVSSVAINNHEVWAGSIDGYLRSFDVRMGTLTEDCVGEGLTCVRVSRDGNCVLLSCMDGKVRLLDKSNGEMLQTYTGHTHTSYKVESCLTQGDEFAVSGSEDGRILFWGLVDGKMVHTLKGHSHVVTSLDYHPTDNALLSSSVDGTVTLWT